MSQRRLIIQAIGDEPDVFTPYIELSRVPHREYADRCGARYFAQRGLWPGAPHPSWNRVPMILDALSAGFDKIVWLDADTLVCKPEANIFDATPDDVALQMVREHDTIERGFGVDVWNAGVLVVNAVQQAYDALALVWAMRSTSPREHHLPYYYEQNWLIDWCIAHPDGVGELGKEWNWMPWAGGNPVPESAAVIKAWHGWPEEFRWPAFQQAYNEFYG